MKKSTKIIFALVAAAVASEPLWATDEAKTQTALTNDFGMSAAKVGGSYGEYGFFRCGFDVNVTKFEATDKAGQRFSGYACSNPWSNKVRLEVNSPRK